MNGFKMLSSLLKIYPAICTLISLLTLTGCSSPELYSPLPAEFEPQAQVIGFKNIRAWGDESNKAMEASARTSAKQEIKANRRPLHQMNALALSGGGADGAFGAGLLCGWTKTGNRPQFHLVSGISTGALIAPFAFLGPKYDAKLTELYTTLSDENIYELKNPFSIIASFIKPVLSPAIASNEPLAVMIRKTVNRDMLHEIAQEHLKGRRLFIGTSQLNAQRLVIWDIGAIATSGNPHALELVHKILLASSALPGIFPPQYFSVEGNGGVYKEMHVDGGVETQVMLFQKAIYPYATVIAAPGQHAIKRLYIIRNHKVSPEWKNVKPSINQMASRVISTLTKTQGIGDLYRLYTYCLRSHIQYNLAYIPDSFKSTAKSPFDNDYMKQLFTVGYNMGKKGYPWQKFPPGY